MNTRLRTIAVIGGTGAEGFGLALRFAGAGAAVLIGSRELAKAQDAARRIAQAAPGAKAEGRLNRDAAAQAEIAVLTVPLAAQIATLRSLQACWREGAVLVDATVPVETAIGGSVAHSIALWAGSAAEQAARYVPAGVRVVSAFHVLGAEALARLDAPVDCDVPICSNDQAAKALVSELAAMIPGVRAIDAGGLENSRLVENAAVLLIALNIRHKAKHSGIRFTGLA
jgi:NADPH-dependent F420 reductase